MFRGFLSGIIWGGVIVIGVLAVASLLAPLPATVTPQTSAATSTEGATQDTQGSAMGTSSKTDGQVSEAAAGEVLEPDDEDQPLLSDTASAPKPETGSSEVSMATPDAPENGGAVAIEGESPVLPNPQAVTPDAPAAETELSISTNPPQPQAPDVSAEGAFPTPVSEPEAAAEETESAQDATDMTPSAEEGAPQEEAVLLKPAGALEDKFPQHKSNRLPTVAGQNDDDTSEQATATPDSLQAPRPVVSNAQAFANPTGKPVMTIVLLDVADTEVDLEVLVSFPYPLSIAISTLDPEIGAKTKRYRDKGFEVLAIIDLPAQAAAADVEVAMQAHLAVSDGFVGVMEGLGDGLQGSKTVSDQVSRVLLDSGHGLLMMPNGFNTAQKLAAKDGVPSATVFRDFDSKGQTAVVMRRFLDQAAFKASQDASVVMIGRLRPDTVAALLLWGLQDRAETVALAPVSAAFATIN